MEHRIGQKRDLATAVFYLLALGLVLRLGVGVFITNRYDTYWYRQWILDFQNGFFDIYGRADAIALDYPPLFLVLVYPISLLYKIVPPDTYEMADMLFLKLIPIVFDVAAAWLFYAMGGREGEAELGLAAAAFWVLNPSMFFNSAVWGQTDSVMCFLLLLAFWLMRREKAVASTVVFAASCMIKFQCLFFAPVFLLGLLDTCNVFLGREKAEILKGIKRLGLCAAVGIISVAAVFLSFAVASRDFTLFPGIYFSSGGKYPYCTLNAFNFFGALGLNWVEYSQNVLGPITWAHLGYILVALGLVMLAVCFIYGQRRCVFVASFFIMQHIFMFMPAMHERYQVAVLPFCLAAWLVHKERKFLHLSVALSVFTLVNQLMVLANATKGGSLPWSANFNQWMAAASFVNLIVYFASAVLCILFMLRGDKSKEREE